MKIHWWSDQEGLTLVELIAAMSIGLVLILFAGKAFNVWARLLTKQQQVREWNLMTETAGILLGDQLTYVTALEVSYEEHSSGDYDHVLTFTKEGRLLSDGQPMFDDVFYGDKKLVLSVDVPASGKDDDVLACDILIENEKNKAFYSKRSVLQLINLKPEGRYIVYSDRSRKTMRSDLNNLYIYYR